MSTSAVVMLIISIVMLWGGLIAAIINLRVRPTVDEASLPPVPPELLAEDLAREQEAPLQRDT